MQNFTLRPFFHDFRHVLFNIKLLMLARYIAFEGIRIESVEVPWDVNDLPEDTRDGR